MYKRFYLILCIILGVGSIVIGQAVFQRDTDFNSWLPSHINYNAFSGAAWSDLNNNGFPDIIIPPNAVFFNNGDGTFTRDLTTTIGQGFLVFARNVSGVSIADIDNDNDLDVFVNCSRPTPNAINRDALYLNDGYGKFTLDTLGPWNPLELSWGCAWGDFDNNGFVDLVTAHPQGFLTSPRPSSFFINTTGLPAEFKKDTTFGFTKVMAPYTVPYWSDYDMDGDQDLFIASGPGGTSGFDSVYTNLLIEYQSPTLQPNSELFSKEIQDGQCYNFIDFDNDGDKDLFLTNWSGAPNNFYVNNNGRYINKPMPFSYNKSSLTNAWGDVDNDGDLDVIITNHNSNKLELWLNENAQFALSKGEFCNQYGNAGFFFADFNNDGFLDGYATGANRSGALYINQVNKSNHWLALSLKGTSTNGAAIGTNIRIVARIGGESVSQLREVSAQNAFQGHHDLRQHVGLGDATTIDSIIIHWPSGITENYTDIRADQFYTIVEGRNITLSHIEKDVSSKMETQFSIIFDSMTNRLTINQSEVMTTLENVAIYNLQGNLIQEIEWNNQYKSKAVQLGDIPPGTYFLHMTTDKNKMLSKKFIKN